MRKNDAWEAGSVAEVVASAVALPFVLPLEVAFLAASRFSRGKKPSPKRAAWPHALTLDLGSR